MASYRVNFPFFLPLHVSSALLLKDCCVPVDCICVFHTIPRTAIINQYWINHVDS